MPDERRIEPSKMRDNTRLVGSQNGLPWPAIAYLIAVVTPINMNIGPIFLTSVRAALLILFIPSLIRLLTGKAGRMLITDLFFFLFMAWGIFALAITSPSQAISQGGSIGLEFIGGYLIGRVYIRDQGSFISLCKWLVVLVLISTPFSIYETLTGRPIIVEYLRKIPGIASVSMITIEGRLGLERVQYTFAHPIHYGLFCSVAFSLCFVALKGTYTLARRLLSSFIIMMTGFLALSSGALLAIALQIFLIAWSLIFASAKSRWWILLGVFVLAYLAIDLLSSRAPVYVFMSYATFSAHNAYWRSIIFEWGVKNLIGDVTLNIPAAPWFGLGMNDWVRPYYMKSGSMDNFWLVTAIRYGFPGLALLLMGYVSAIFQVMRRSFDGYPQLSQIRQAWVFTFFGLSFTLSTVFVWTNIYSFVFFIFGAGVWLITVDGSNEESSSINAARLPVEKQVGYRYTRFPHKHSFPIRPKE